MTVVYILDFIQNYCYLIIASHQTNQQEIAVAVSRSLVLACDTCCEQRSCMSYCYTGTQLIPTQVHCYKISENEVSLMIFIIASLCNMAMA